MVRQRLASPDGLPEQQLSPACSEVQQESTAQMPFDHACAGCVAGLRLNRILV